MLMLMLRIVGSLINTSYVIQFLKIMFLDSLDSSLTEKIQRARLHNFQNFQHIIEI